MCIIWGRPKTIFSSLRCCVQLITSNNLIQIILNRKHNLQFLHICRALRADITNLFKVFCLAKHHFLRKIDILRLKYLTKFGKKIACRSAKLSVLPVFNKSPSFLTNYYMYFVANIDISCNAEDISSNRLLSIDNDLFSFVIFKRLPLEIKQVHYKQQL